MGDYRDLADLAQWCRRVNAGYLFLGPTNAGYLTRPMASPYSPSSRLFHNIAHLHPPAIDGWSRLPADVRAEAERAARLNELPCVAHDRALAAKLRVLRPLYDAARRRGGEADPRLRRFRASGGTELRLFALYCAIESQLGPHWAGWPPDLRTPQAASSSVWAKRHEELIGFFEWCQWQLDGQFRAAAGHGTGLVRDLPVGTPIDSADAWMWQECVATGWQLGAPPDYFNADGHGWGLVPFRPLALASAGFRPFRLAVRATLRYAAGIRIDHALGLLRQYWIPAGGRPSAGRYVRQPTRPLLDIICIEAHRRQAFVVSEELGTPPPTGRDALRARGFLDYCPVTSDEFDQRSADAILSASTHDLPTVAGCLTGADERLLAAAGVPADPAFAARASGRLRALAGLAHDAPPAAVAERLYRVLAASDSPVVVASIEDALGIGERPNVPGAGTRWPSFSRGLPMLSGLLADGRVARLAAAIADSR
jgi:4-alpha-glucanotransferase